MADAIVLDAVYYVYVLYREDGVTPFYVGKGTGKRIRTHAVNARPGKSHKDNIICKMLSNGIEVRSEKIAEGLTEPEAYALEVELIAQFKRVCDGGTLANVTIGGDGVRSLSPEAEAKRRAGITAAQKGRSWSPAQREAIVAGLRRVKSWPKRGPHSPESTQKRIASLKAMWAEVPIADRSKRGMSGKSHSDETKSRMREKALGRKMSDAQKAAVSYAQKGRKASAETRAKMTESQRLRWKTRKESELRDGGRDGNNP